MVGPTTPGRPQTLRQAKKAYRKSAAGPKLSAKELAIAERRATLEERANRIKEREARKKTNARKREEKKAKEKATLARLGKPTPSEGGFKIGPSQLDLTNFLPPVERKSRDYADMEKTQEKIDELQRKNNEKAEGSSPSSNAMTDEVRDVNMKDEKAVNADELDLKEAEETERSAHTNEALSDKVKEVDMKDASTILMPPPARPASNRLLNFQEPTAPANVSRPQQFYNDDFADLFVSNTQIERELSPPPAKAQAQSSRSAPTTVPLIFTRRDDTASLLAQISTQDLDCTFTQVDPEPSVEQSLKLDSGYATKYQTPLQKADTTSTIPLPGVDDFNLSTQDLDLGDLTQQPTKAASEPDLRTRADSKSSSFDLGDDFTDQDLTFAAEEVESSASRSSHSSSETPEIMTRPRVLIRQQQLPHWNAETNRKGIPSTYFRDKWIRENPYATFEQFNPDCNVKFPVPSDTDSSSASEEGFEYCDEGMCACGHVLCPALSYAAGQMGAKKSQWLPGSKHPLIGMKKLGGEKEVHKDREVESETKAEKQKSWSQRCLVA